jgi:hypothetical protein
MKPLLLMIVMLLGIFFCVHAQQPDTTQPAVLVLNDGSIIKGQRIDALQPGHVRLRMADGTEVEFPIESVAEIRKDMPPSRAPRKPYKVQSKGLYAAIATGFLFGNIEQEPVSFTCGAAIGYRFLPQLYLAAGGGTDIHPNSGDKFAPIYVRVGGEAMKTRVTPNYFFASGYAFPYKTPDGYFDAKGGAYYEGGLGVTFRTASRVSMTLNAIYRQYNAERSYNNDWWWGNDGSFSTDKRTYRRFGVLFGVSF